MEHLFDEDDLVQLAFLRDEETDALISAGLLGDDCRFSSPLDDLVILSFDDVILNISSNIHYPVRDFTYELENIRLSREAVDELRHQLREIVSAAQITNNIENWQKREENNAFGIFEPVKTILLMGQKTTQYLADHHASQFQLTSTEPSSSSRDKHLWFLSPDAKQPAALYDTTTSSTSELAYRLLRLSPKQIAAEIPSYFRVLHVEQVLRTDHARNMLNFQSILRRKLARLPQDQIRCHVPVELRSRRTEDMLDHLVKPRLTFHGTQRHNVPSIVRHGFIAPGEMNPELGTEQDVRCGSTYGRGIYSSPNANFALSYSGGQCQRTSPKEFFGLKLVICATIMGRPRIMYREDDWRTENVAHEGADSHVANGDMEYIVFNPSQTIPVYVAHLDWGEENAKFFADIPDDPKAWHQRSNRLEKQQKDAALCPGDRQRAKEAIYAKAAKYFPYGYGPATGTRFVVEEVGEISEDEEDYGDYQSLRVDEREDGVANTEFWSWVKAAEVADHDCLQEGTHDADEYLEKRHALKVPQGFGKAADVWDSLKIPGSEAEGPDKEEDDDDGFHLATLMLEQA